MIWDEVATFEQLLLLIENCEQYATDDVCQNTTQCVMVAVDCDSVETVEVKLETDETQMFLDVPELDCDEQNDSQELTLAIEQIDDFDIDEVDDDEVRDITTETAQNLVVPYALQQNDMTRINIIDDNEVALETECLEIAICIAFDDEVDDDEVIGLETDETDRLLETLDEARELDKVEMVEYGENDEIRCESIVVGLNELEDDETVIYDETEQNERELYAEVEDDEIDDFELYVVEIDEQQDTQQPEMVEKQSRTCIDLFWERIHFRTMWFVQNDETVEMVEIVIDEVVVLDDSLEIEVVVEIDDV